MYVSSIAGDKHATNSKLGYLAMMDLEVAAPVQGLRLEIRGARSRRIRCTISSEGASPSFSWTMATIRRRVALMGKMATGPASLGTQLQLVCRKRLVALDIGQNEQRVVLCSFKRKIQQVADRAVSSIAANDECRRDLAALALPLQCRGDEAVMLDGGDECGFVLDVAAATL